MINVLGRLTSHLGKGEVESSILSRSTIQALGSQPF